jgi:regulatory protein
MPLILSGARSEVEGRSALHTMAQDKRQRAGLDEAALEKAALDYLAHYASSVANLRRVLLRRIARTAAADGADVAAGARLADAVVARAIAAGFLDDRAYAAQQAVSLNRRGVSSHAIRFRLKEKGVDEDHIAAALAGLGAPRVREIEAACALARRRRLGPFRPAAARADFRERDLGALARAGFGLDIARLVLAAPDPESLARLAQDENPSSS